VLLQTTRAGVSQQLIQPRQNEGKAPQAAGEEKGKGAPDKRERWQQAAHKPGLTPRQKLVFEQFSKLRQYNDPRMTIWGQLPIPPDPSDPLNVLSRIGLDVLPQLTEALDDDTPIPTVTTDRLGAKKQWRVNDLIARLIVQIADREFTIPKEPGTFPPEVRNLDALGIRELNSQPGATAAFKKVVLDWYANNRRKNETERKIADLNDPWNNNAALRWLGEHPGDAGRRAIEMRVDAVLAELRQRKRIHSGMWMEIASSGQALGKNKDEASLPKVREICDYLTAVDKDYATNGTGSSGPNAYTFYEAYHGVALLCQKEEALLGLQAAYDRYRSRYGVQQNQEYEEVLARARKW
jgi:hypothetical protein